jgi:hypothetical protein
LTTAVVVGGLVLVALPHALALRGSTPGWAATLWLAELVARAVVVLLAIAWLVVVVPGSDLFVGATRWCWHAVLPYLATHLRFSGHGVGDAALLIPALAVAVSGLAAGHGVMRATAAVQRYLRRSAVGSGPGGSVIVPGPEVLLAAAGIARPRVVVSAGALLQLDDEELAAGLEHERGHIARRHRWLLLAGELARGVGRPIPGSSRALRELSFHLERDADRWTLRRRHDRLALASVICKAATTAVPLAAVASLGGADVTARVRELMGEAPARSRPGRGAIARVVAVCLVAGAVGTAIDVPGAFAVPAASGDLSINCSS